MNEVFLFLRGGGGLVVSIPGTVCEKLAFSFRVVRANDGELGVYTQI